MDPDDITRRFTYHPPLTPDRAEAHELARGVCRETAAMLAALLPDGREKSLAITKLEEALMWANAAIARE